MKCKKCGHSSDVFTCKTCGTAVTVNIDNPKYTKQLESDIEFVLNRLEEAIAEPNREIRRDLYEAAIEVCVHTRGG
jgi:uncharacterized membrane protein YvbJ